MAGKKNANTRASNDAKKFEEFEINAKNGNVFTGRLYTEPNKTENSTRYYVSLKINGLAIRNCNLVIGSNKTFISLPSYKKSDGEYDSVVFFTEKDDIADLEECAMHLSRIIG